MKKIIYSIVCPCLLLLMAIQLNAQTKPNIEVGFTIEGGNFFYDLFEDDINMLETEAVPILTSGLNTYISFLAFGTQSAGNQLNIYLKKDPLSVGIIEEYILEFQLNDESGQVHEHTWLFLDSATFESLDGSADVLLEVLTNRWNTYLKGAYNNELVAKLFDKIPLAIPDSSHYYESGATKEAILPFKNEELRMELDECEFTVKVNGKNTDGVPTTHIQKRLTYAGFVEDVMTNIPEKLRRCIRIRLNPVGQMEFLDGLVFITDFARMPDASGNNTPEDFVNSIN